MYANTFISGCEILRRKLKATLFKSTTYLYNTRLMSDYEVTLVNDNSMFAFCSPALHILMSFCQCTWPFQR
jgi:hypothetical protein